jgi:hypothetical protein
MMLPQVIMFVDYVFAALVFGLAGTLEHPVADFHDQLAILQRKKPGQRWRPGFASTT